MSETGRVLPTRLLLAAAALTVGVAACSSTSPTQVVATSYHGVEPTSEVARPSWTLTDTDGRAFDFGAQTKGKVTLVYYGYTHCPDECPTAMADIAAALRLVPKELAAGVKVIFVTTDPRRDSGFVLRRFLNQFSTTFIGLRGTQAQVDIAQQAAGVEKAHPEGPLPTVAGNPAAHPGEAGTAPHKHFGPLGYSVAHSAVIYAYDATDHLPVVYPGGVTPADIAADLPVLAR